MPWVTINGAHVLIGEDDEGRTSDAALFKARKAKVAATRGPMVERGREGTGKDAKIVLADGSKAGDHIKPSMIPPKWTGVKVSSDPKAEVLATARDEKGRLKTVYAESYSNKNAAIKFGRTEDMLKEHDKISGEIQKERSGPHKEEAECAWLMQVQATRPGSDHDTGGKVKAYGATTLEARHVVQAPDGVRLQFIGKEGVAHNHLVRDQELGKMLLSRKQAAASDNDRLFKTDAEKVRAFTAERDSGKFTPKDFRTGAGTIEAIKEVQKDPRPSKDLKEHKARVKAVAEKVSGLLGNKPAEALKSYIHPAVFAQWTPT